MVNGVRTLLAAYVWPFQRVYSQLGVPDREQLAILARYGVPVDTLTSPGARLPLEQALAHAEEQAARLGRSDLGLLAAQAVLPGDLGALEQAARACATLGEAVQLLSDGIGVLADGAHLSVEPRGERAAIRFWTDPDLALPSWAVEFSLLALLRVGSFYYGASVQLDAVRFRHPEVPHAASCASLFGCRVSWGAPEDALLVARSLLDAPMASASPAAAQLLRARVEVLAAEVGSDELIRRVEESIAQHIAQGVPSVPRLAQWLGVGERTLHRRLKDAGTSHRKLCEQVRLRLARHYLEETGLPIKQVAANLGYRDVPPFHRAFKRATGETPAQHRRRHRPAR